MREEAKHLLVTLEEDQSVFFSRSFHGRTSNWLRICRIQTLTSICTALFCNLNELLPKQFFRKKQAMDHLVVSTLLDHERISSMPQVDTNLPPCNVCTFEFWIWVSWSSGNFSCCKSFRSTTTEPCVSLLWKVDCSSSFINHHFDYILVPLFSLVESLDQKQTLLAFAILVSCWNPE